MLALCSARVALSCVLGLTAGFVDVICLARYGAFAATQTGNLVFIGRSIASCLFFGGAFKQLLYSVTVLISNFSGALCIAAVDHFYPTKTASFAAPYLALLTLLGDLTGSWDNVYRTIRGELAPAASPHNPLDSEVDLHRWHEGELTGWSVCLVAASMGATHFLGSGATHSRLKAPTFAGTGHLHKVAKALFSHTLGSTFTTEVNVQSMGVVLCIVLGAVLGAAALRWNPLEDTPAGGDAYLLVPVALVQYCVLRAHDELVPPPEGWPAALVEPLATKCGG